MGVAHELCHANLTTRIIALEPASSPIISTGTVGTHHVEGVGIGFVPPLLDSAHFDEARGVHEKETQAMARRLAAEEGIFDGTSVGLNVVAAPQLARELSPGKTVVTVASDFGLKYLAGDLYVI